MKTMQPTRSENYGCLTGVGIIAALVAVFSIVGVAIISGGQMFTAGALNAKEGKTYNGVSSHAQITECSACHSAPWTTETMADRCASCHENISAQLADANTLHGSIMDKTPTATCRDCHPEHRGADAPITEINEGAFPHEKLGYSLQGHPKTSAGVAFVCRDCHPNSGEAFTVATCDTCHREIDAKFTESHVKAFGTECLTCHDGVDKFGSDFDHNIYPFKLEGDHARTSCAGCHKNARTIADLQAASQDCYACHEADDREEHNGALGKKCYACHSTSDWEDGTKINHDLLGYKLEGKHAEIKKCMDCHIDRQYLVTPTDCYSCHQDNDIHNGEYGKNCEECHTPNDWKDVTVDHSLFPFKLEGAHANVKCSDCHLADVAFKDAPTDCYSCHANDDEHQGDFGKDCAVCHTVNAWEPATFNGEHTFPLRHEGAEGDCKLCHPDSLKTYTCYGCHEHNESRIGSEHREEGISNFEDCMECHPTGREHEGEGRRGGDD